MEEKKRYRTICPKCGKAKDFMLEESRINRWKNGEFIQNVFPEFNADDRGRLISGICDSCWSKIFANVEDCR